MMHDRLAVVTPDPSSGDQPFTPLTSPAIYTIKKTIYGVNFDYNLEQWSKGLMC